VKAVAVPASGFLVSDQILKRNYGDGDAAQLGLDASIPCVVEHDSINCRHDIHSHRSHAELKHDVVLRQVVNRKIRQRSAEFN
jgi:hypothetical protein